VFNSDTAYITQLKHLLRIVFRENYGYSNEYQSVDIKVLGTISASVAA